MRQPKRLKINSSTHRLVSKGCRVLKICRTTFVYMIALFCHWLKEKKIVRCKDWQIWRAIRDGFLGSKHNLVYKGWLIRDDFRGQV